MWWDWGISGGSCGLYSCVVTFVGDLHVSLFENIGDFPNLWCGVGESGPL